MYICIYKPIYVFAYTRDACAVSISKARIFVNSSDKWHSPSQPIVEYK